MDARSLSDVNNLKDDFNTLLDLIFNNSNPVKQPNYIVELNAQNGMTLRYTYNYIQNSTSRGKDLLTKPLKVIAILNKNSLTNEVQNDLSEIPHEIMVCSVGVTAQDIIDKLKSLNIEDTQLCLYLEFFSDNFLPFNEYSKLRSQFGLIALKSYHDSQSLETAVDYIEEAAKEGWFSKVIYQYPKSPPITRATLCHFEQRPYRVRSANSNDLATILNLEKSCINEKYRVSEHVIKQCMNYSLEDQLVIEIGKEIVGFILSQKIANLDNLNGSQENSIDKIYDPKGSIILLITLLVLPEKHELKDYLLEFFLQKAFITDNISHVAAILRCESYPGQDVISMESYVDELIHEKGSSDIAIKLHVTHGAEVKCPIRGYRPEDIKNLNYGILVIYSRSTLLHPTSSLAAKEIFSHEEINPESIQSTIDQMVKVYLNQSSYDRSLTFEQIGLDSINLLQLRASLSIKFSMDLPRNFFVIHHTPQSIINFFIESKLQLYKQWLYEIKWQSTAIPQPEILEPGKLWIIFENFNDNTALSLKEMFHEYGQRCISVVRSNEFLEVNKENYTINFTLQEDYKKLFENITNIQDLAGIIYLWNDTENLNELIDPPIEILETAHRNTIEGFLFLLNALAAFQIENAPRVWVVTQSIEQDGKSTSLAEWPLSALCKVAREEYQKFNCTLISIDPQEKPIESSERLFNEIRSKVNEPHVAFRRNERLVPRLIHCEIERIRIPKFSSHAFYLIAGYRPLGILIARWYVSHGARHLILVDEIDIYPEIVSVIEDLKKQGIEIIIEKVKLDDEVAIGKIFDKISHGSKPLKGIVHALGVVGNELMMRSSWNHFKTNHRLKVTLSWHLHRYSQKFDLDHFVLFSSCLPDIAPLGKANHATGNSFLDALSHYRWKRALPSLTIDWGPWELRYMQIERPFETNTSDLIQMIEIKKGLQALDHFFYIQKPQIMTAVVNWQSLISNLGDMNPLFYEIAVEMGLRRVEILRQYIESNPNSRTNLIQAYLHELTRKILKLRSNVTLENGREFTEIGMDTIKMSALRNYIQLELHEAVRLPFNFVEKNSSLEKLSKALTLILDEVIKSKPKVIIGESLAIIGLKDNQINVDVLQKDGINIELKELSGDVLKELQGKLQKSKFKKVPKIIIVENNE